MSIQGTYHWSDVHQKAFDQTKSVMVHTAELVFPSDGEPFHIHTDT
ncbi:hypothetical protein PI125_g14736 [Phytophthora idaei]|nr:hypothetical protein PI125_g14736 [Phytophthora idaei]